MRVIAIKEGFFGGKRVRAGQVFEVPAGAKGKWFAPAAPLEKPKAESKVEPKVKVKPPKAAEPAADDLT